MGMPPPEITEVVIWKLALVIPADEVAVKPVAAAKKTTRTIKPSRLISFPPLNKNSRITPKRKPGCFLETRGFPSPPHGRFGVNLKGDT